MAIRQDGKRMEGWLYIIRSNRLGLQYSRKRYFVLEDNSLNCFKFSTDKKSDPIRSALIDSCIRVTDNGRESIHMNVFFIFTLYSAANHNDQLKLGARSSEEAAMWIHSLKEASMKEWTSKVENIVACSKSSWRSFRSTHTKERTRMNSIDWTLLSSMRMDPMSSDVIAPSPWTIIGCNNGLRLFEETKDGDFSGKIWDDHPAIMAVGVVDGTSEAIFRTVMSFGPSRSEWDFCLSHGTVVEHLDGHTDIIHKKLRGDWLPWGMKRRDLLLRRYWRREDDGTYVILYHSVFHENCRPVKGYIRACLKSGGYVISPINQGKQSVVKHMLAIDWKLWKSYLFNSSGKYVTIRMLGRVSALRELYRAKLGTCTFSDDSGELKREIELPHSEKEDIKVEMLSEDDHIDSHSIEESRKSSTKSPNIGGSFLQLNNAADEFFDVPDESEFDQSVDMWPCDDSIHSQVIDSEQVPPRISTASVFVKKLHNLAVGCIDLQEVSSGSNEPCSYGATLPKDPSCNVPCSWTNGDPSAFLIRGESYLQDNRKVKANNTLMQMVAADWIKSDKTEDDLGSRPGGIVQRYAQDCSKFFLIVNIQVPGGGTTMYSLALYYMMETPLEDVPLLKNFVTGDDAYRNSRFKLIPYISKGSWIVKQSVGKKACLVGQGLETNYFRGTNYLELDIDVSSSTVARGVVSLVLSYLNNLVIEMAFLIQGNTQEELPEVLLGTCRLNQLDVAKAVPVEPVVTGD